MGDGTKRNPALDDEIASVASEALTRARASEQPWLDLRTLLGRERPSDVARRVLDKLLAEGSLVELGEQGRQQRFALVRGSRQDTLLQLGCELLRRRAKGRFALYPATATSFKGDRSVPSTLRGTLPEALKLLVNSGEAFIVKVGRGASYFALRADMEATLAAAPTQVQVVVGARSQYR